MMTTITKRFKRLLKPTKRKSVVLPRKRKGHWIKCYKIMSVFLQGDK